MEVLALEFGAAGGGNFKIASGFYQGGDAIKVVVGDVVQACVFDDPTDHSRRGQVPCCCWRFRSEIVCIEREGVSLLLPRVEPLLQQTDKEATTEVAPSFLALYIRDLILWG